MSQLSTAFLSRLQRSAPVVHRIVIGPASGSGGRASHLPVSRLQRWLCSQSASRSQTKVHSPWTMRSFSPQTSPPSGGGRTVARSRQARAKRTTAVQPNLENDMVGAPLATCPGRAANYTRRRPLGGMGGAETTYLSSSSTRAVQSSSGSPSDLGGSGISTVRSPVSGGG